MVRLLSPRIRRSLRITATALMLLLSATLVVLWFRNFRGADVGWAPLPSGGHVVVVSQQGQMEFVFSKPSPASLRTRQATKTASSWGGDTYSVVHQSAVDVLFPRVKPLRYRRLWPAGLNMMTPYRFLVPFTVALSAVPWIKWSSRFSLRALLVGTTIIAVALGIYVRGSW
jgi:hypothetical protein